MSHDPVGDEDDRKQEQFVRHVERVIIIMLVLAVVSVIAALLWKYGS